MSLGYNKCAVEFMALGPKGVARQWEILQDLPADKKLACRPASLHFCSNLPCYAAVRGCSLPRNGPATSMCARLNQTRHAQVAPASALPRFFNRTEQFGFVHVAKTAGASFIIEGRRALGNLFFPMHPMGLERCYFYLRTECSGCQAYGIMLRSLDEGMCGRSTIITSMT